MHRNQLTRKLAVGCAVIGLVVTASATAASAHQHQIVTEGTVVTLPCEPFHGETPGHSESSANWDTARGLHPIHHGLHMSPSKDRRNIEVVVSSTSCP